MELVPLYNVHSLPLQQAAQVDVPSDNGHVLFTDPHVSAEPTFINVVRFRLNKFRVLSYLFKKMIEKQTRQY